MAFKAIQEADPSNMRGGAVEAHWERDSIDFNPQNCLSLVCPDADLALSGPSSPESWHMTDENKPEQTITIQSKPELEPEQADQLEQPERGSQNWHFGKVWA